MQLENPSPDSTPPVPERPTPSAQQLLRPPAPIVFWLRQDGRSLPDGLKMVERTTAGPTLLHTLDKVNLPAWHPTVINCGADPAPDPSPTTSDWLRDPRPSSSLPPTPPSPSFRLVGLSPLSLLYSGPLSCISVLITSYRSHLPRYCLSLL